MTSLQKGANDWQNVEGYVSIPLPDQNYAALAGVGEPRPVLQQVLRVSSTKGIISRLPNGTEQRQSLESLAAYVQQQQGVDAMQGIAQRAEQLRSQLASLGLSV